MTQLKQCNICKEYKPATNEFFSKVKTKKDGLNGTCKVSKLNLMNLYIQN
ncbi:MAG: hypothetical protein SOT71_09420 [Romboutsia timonensis]|nr:hypothetical protein [Romboutsia timonensis]MDY2882856.1 hypothetical protein [Romboutsia timonensis]